MVAAIDTARQRAVHPGLVEVAAATVLSSLQNDKAQAEANSRLTELHALQLELVNGTDDSRKSLESDLHDGAQQRLVGLSLAARLSARSGDSEAVRQQLASQLRLARQDVLALLESGVPVPLRSGLAGALRTLAATSAVRTELEVAGDLARTTDWRRPCGWWRPKLSPTPRSIRELHICASSSWPGQR